MYVNIFLDDFHFNKSNLYVASNRLNGIMYAQLYQSQLAFASHTM